MKDKEGPLEKLDRLTHHLSEEARRRGGSERPRDAVSPAKPATDPMVAKAAQAAVRKLGFKPDEVLRRTAEAERLAGPFASPDEMIFKMLEV